MTTERGYEFRENSLTRPDVRGRDMVVSCGHYLASLAGMRMRELGGNAIDAGVSMVFCQTLLESKACGFGGEAPILIHSAESGKTYAINGNTTAPLAATRKFFLDKGILMIPGDGFLPAGVPAVPGALITALSRFGRLSLAKVLEPAIQLAENGFPVYQGFRDALTSCNDRFRDEWPSSARLYLPDGKVPETGELFMNKDLAETFRTLVKAEADNLGKGREKALQAARDAFYLGDIAARIVAFQAKTHVRDANGTVSNGLLTEEDFSRYETRIEETFSVEYKGLTVHKAGFWSQGPVFLQQLNLLKHFNLDGMDPLGHEYIHTVVEVSKLAFADREKYYGDPEHADVPERGLLSMEYAEERSRMVDASKASLELLPGNPYPYQSSPFIPETGNVKGSPWQGGTTGTRAVDAEGNMFSATPSGGWLQSSPVIEGLGFCLGTRCQMFWLEDDRHPNALEPGKRPRTTLTPTLVTRDGRPHMVFGTPGGDNQDQWNLQFFLNTVHFGMGIQQAIDFPCFQSVHFPSSFYPRIAQPGRILIEGRFPQDTLEQLEAKGHNVEKTGDWSQGFTTAVAYDPDRKVITGGASSRYPTNYALGW
ncbi:MAG: gamma-glutamyltransferase family protein [Clostridia bacterium]